MIKKEYDFILSIGEDCACTAYLRNHNLQMLSYPFDWLTKAAFETRLELILNDFENFLNLEDLKFLEKTPEMFNDKHCDYYENTRNGFYYFHEFPKDEDPKNSFDEVKDKYDRRIKRTYESIQSAERVLFVWLSHSKNTPDDLIISLHNKIIQKFNKNIDFLIIENDSSKSINEIEQREISPGITKFELDTATFDKNGNATQGNKKNLDKVFKQYKLSKAVRSKLYYDSQKFLIKFVCVFIPVKSWRKKLRDIYST